MSKMFPEGVPAAREWEAHYLDVWRALPSSLRNRIRAGVDRVTAEDVRELGATGGGPWVLDGLEDGASSVKRSFVQWAQTEAPGEDAL